MDSVIQSPACANQDPAALFGGRRNASGAGRADGGTFGPVRGPSGDGRPRFSVAVESNGYAWWYVDALSDDGRHGLTIIALIGSVFSPYYAHARRRGSADPRNHVAMNVALYGPGRKRWAMTERDRHDLERSDDILQIGPSCMTWRDDALTIEIDEMAVPVPRRIRGTIRLLPSALQMATFAIDGDGRHLWRPIAPVARVQVDFEQPSLHWRGHGYFDHNIGTSPLEDAFTRWHWSRANTAEGATIFYDVALRHGARPPLALHISREGHAQAIEPPTLQPLPATGWRIQRATRSDPDIAPRVISTLEDTPFYARSIVSASVADRAMTSMHESLDLDRFNARIVQAMLPFRMPRRARQLPG